jgi:hypothetical protein
LGPIIHQHKQHALSDFLYMINSNSVTQGIQGATLVATKTLS